MILLRVISHSSIWLFNYLLAIVSILLRFLLPLELSCVTSSNQRRISRPVNREQLTLVLVIVKFSECFFLVYFKSDIRTLLLTDIFDSLFKWILFIWWRSTTNCLLGVLSQELALALVLVYCGAGAAFNFSFCLTRNFHFYFVNVSTKNINDFWILGDIDWSFTFKIFDVKFWIVSK